MGVLLNHHPLKNRMFHEINQPSIYILCIYIYINHLFIGSQGTPMTMETKASATKSERKLCPAKCFVAALAPGMAIGVATRKPRKPKTDVGKVTLW